MTTPSLELSRYPSTKTHKILTLGSGKQKVCFIITQHGRLLTPLACSTAERKVQLRLCVLLHNTAKCALETHEIVRMKKDRHGERAPSLGTSAADEDKVKQIRPGKRDRCLFIQQKGGKNNMAECRFWVGSASDVAVYVALWVAQWTKSDALMGGASKSRDSEISAAGLTFSRDVWFIPMPCRQRSVCRRSACGPPENPRQWSVTCQAL